MQINLLNSLKMLRVGSLLASVVRLFHSFTSRYEKYFCPFTDDVLIS